jgi:phosphohistidine swiveling domain-containing protein
LALFKLVTRRFPPLQAFAFIVGHRDYVDFGYTYTASLPEGAEGNSIWLLEEEHFDHARKLGEIASSNPQFVPNLIADCYKRANDLMDISRKITNSHVKNMSNVELQETFSKYFTAYLKLTRHLFTPHYVEIAFTKVIREWLYTELKDKVKEVDISAYFDSIAIATKETQTTQSEEHLLTIASRVAVQAATSDPPLQKSELLLTGSSTVPPEIDRDIDGVVQMYGWLPMINLGNQPMERKDVIALVQKTLADSNRPLEKLQAIRENSSRQRAKMESVLRELAPPAEILEKIRQFQEFIYLRTYRMEVYGKSHFMILPLLEEIARRARLDILRLKFMTHEEVLTFLRSGKRPTDAELDQRLKTYAILMENSYIHPLFSGAAAGETKKQQLRESGLLESAAELSGTPACMGIAVGPARIVKSPEDFNKIQSGDVIVTVMTTTEYTPLLPKVAAVVTDEGGITSHAAIVSRELGIPCVVGTKNATRLLRDGELVRVEATKGMIYKVARK